MQLCPEYACLARASDTHHCNQCLPAGVNVCCLALPAGPVQHSDAQHVSVQVAVATHRGSKANGQNHAKSAKRSVQTTQQVAAVVKPVSSRKAATALPSAAQQKAVRTASPLAESDAKETLPVKARIIKGKGASWAPAT